MRPPAKPRSRSSQSSNAAGAVTARSHAPSGREVRFSRPALVLPFLAGLALAPHRVDLDVALPPGSPLDWSSAFPAITPSRRPLRPMTGAAREPRQRSESRAATLDPDVRFANAFGLVRILTWDIAGHLQWISERPRGPLTGRTSLRPPPPSYGDPLHWVALAPLLRLLLHPESLSCAETLVHLVEIGEPVLTVLDSAAGEENLAPVCAELRRRIAVDPGLMPELSPASSVRARTLERFALEECLRDEPCDPSGEFGKRLFLFADEVEPLLMVFLEREGLALRRNAVSALGRIGTPSAQRVLLAVASQVPDPVTVVRALSALGRPPVLLDPAPLVRRLAECDDPVLRVSLIAALGRLRAKGALSLFLELGERALAERDSDLLIALLPAMGRIPPGDQRPAILAFSERVRAAAREHATEFRARSAPSPLQPDVPDAPGTRAEILTQLSWLVDAGLDPLRRGLADEVRALERDAPLDPRLAEDRKGGTDPLGGIFPPVRFFYLEGLQRLGASARLAELAGAPGLESSLRGRALALLPWEQRAALAPTWIKDEKAPVELRIHALEVALLDRDPAVEALCRTILAEAAATEPEKSDGGRRFLWMRALRHLSEEGELRSAELVPLLPHVKRSPAARSLLVSDLRERLAELARAALAGARPAELRAPVAAIVEFVLEQRLNPLLEPGARDELADALLAIVGETKKRAGEPGLEAELVHRALVRLLGPALDFFSGEPRDPGRQLFEPEVPLAEEIVLALGRTRDPEASEPLVALLRERKNPQRAWIALALGLCGTRGAASELLPLLLDEDAFVRFAASEALRWLTGRELPVDWMYGPSDERFAAAQEYRRWFLERGR